MFASISQRKATYTCLEESFAAYRCLIIAKFHSSFWMHQLCEEEQIWLKILWLYEWIHQQCPGLADYCCSSPMLVYPCSNQLDLLVSYTEPPKSVTVHQGNLWRFFWKDQPIGKCWLGLVVWNQDLPSVQPAQRDALNCHLLCPMLPGMVCPYQAQTAICTLVGASFVAWFAIGPQYMVSCIIWPRFGCFILSSRG